MVGRKTDEEILFYESVEVAAMNSIVPYKNDNTYYQLKKRQVSIDDFCEKNLIIPEVIKIDVEGAEIQVFEGAKSTLNKYHPIIILSVHPKHLNLLGDSVDKLLNLIKSNGYNIFNVDGSIPSILEFKEYLLKPNV